MPSDKKIVFKEKDELVFISYIDAKLGGLLACQISKQEFIDRIFKSDDGSQKTRQEVLDGFVAWAYESDLYSNKSYDTIMTAVYNYKKALNPKKELES